MFCRKGNVPTPSEMYLLVGTFRNELFYVTGPRRLFQKESILNEEVHFFLEHFFSVQIMIWTRICTLLPKKVHFLQEQPSGQLTFRLEASAVVQLRGGRAIEANGDRKGQNRHRGFGHLSFQLLSLKLRRFFLFLVSHIEYLLSPTATGFVVLPAEIGKCCKACNALHSIKNAWRRARSVVKFKLCQGNEVSYRE